MSSESEAGCIKGRNRGPYRISGILVDQIPYLRDKVICQSSNVQTGPRQQTEGCPWCFSVHGPRSSLADLGPGASWEDRAYWSPRLYLSPPPTAHSCPTLRCCSVKTDTSLNRGIAAGEKLSNGNLGSKKNVLYVQRLIFLFEIGLGLG